MKIENPSKSYEVVSTYVKLNVKMGWMLNPDKDTVEAGINSLIVTGGKCPSTGEDMCPCVAYREKGECKCKLYVKRPKPKV